MSSIRKEKIFKVFFLVLFLLMLLLQPSTPVQADSIGLITRGIARTFFSAFEIPKAMASNAGQAFPLGMLAGTLTGSVRMVAGTLMGATDIARGAAPYAKYMIFFI